MKSSLCLLLILLLESVVISQSEVSIAQIQGDTYFSPIANQRMFVKGIITAIQKRGYYIQTPDTEIDQNLKSSEGVFVYTYDPPAEHLAVGDYVSVDGKISEFRQKNQRYSLFLTEIVNPKTKVISRANPLPAPILLDREMLRPDGQLDQLERFEGMRIKIESLIVVAPTGGFFDKKTDLIRSDGVFFGVIAGTPRPFREPGLDALKILIDKIEGQLSVFDMNPERIRVDSDTLNGADTIDVTSGAELKDLVGVVDYGFGSYTVLLDPIEKPEIRNNRTFVPLSPATKNEVTVGSFNLENFFDDEKNSNLRRKETQVSSAHFERRLKKTSLAIRDVLSMPDVLGVIEVENLMVLEKLAARINEDAEKANQVNPQYKAILLESNDLRGIDVGFLIRTAKVNVLSVKHLGNDLMLRHSAASRNETLFSRPPIMVELETLGRGTENSLKLTAIVNHIKSYRGIETDRVQQKRRMQSEFLAKTVRDRQAANPHEKIILIGDFNAFQFNDGYNDLIGTLKGKPDLNVLSPAQKIYPTGLIDLVERITKQNRYSYVFGGSAQTLDHILINEPLINHAKKFGYARLNADFPMVYENDETRPERVSDHDVPMVYLSIKPIEISAANQ